MTSSAIDLHCDLLIYLAQGSRRRPWDPLARASLPLMRRGGVTTQALAVYSWVHEDSVQLGARQLEIFESIEAHSKDAARRVRHGESLGATARDRVRVVAALESGATFATESEPLATALERLEGILGRYGPILYVSLTWNEENRFGGGNSSTVGLKPDGRTLLDFLSGRGVAIDLSHTSDALADGILEHVDGAALDLSVLASHSNFRARTDVPRNLPERIAREIIRRGGVIGLNFLARFAGPEGPHQLVEQCAYGLELGGEDALALGADYFATIDIPQDLRHGPAFFPELADSSGYPWLLERMKDRFPEATLQKIWRGNAAAFADRLWGGAGDAPSA